MLMGLMGFWLLENRLFVLYRGEFHDCVSEADLLFGWSKHEIRALSDGQLNLQT